MTSTGEVLDSTGPPSWVSLGGEVKLKISLLSSLARAFSNLIAYGAGLIEKISSWVFSERALCLGSRAREELWLASSGAISILNSAVISELLKPREGSGMASVSVSVN